MTYLKKSRCQFNDVKLSHQIMEAVELFDYKMHNFTQITLTLGYEWSKSAVLWGFFYIICHKWYFFNYT